MKHKRSLFTFAVVLVLVLAVFPGAALAADTEGAEPTPETPPPATLYPAEVRTSEENGMIRLERIYYLSTRDDPAAIPTEDFDREGRHFTLLDVLKNDLSETDTKDYIETVTLESATKDMGEIIKTLEPEREIITEDGYSGILKPDYANITVEPAGYRTNSWTVSATRTYPNLSDADNSMIPKSIEDCGRTLTLANVDWQEASTDYVDGAALAVRYTAVASYAGTATGRSVTGYTVTVDYGGEVTKTSVDTIIYTAVFSAENTSHGETHLEQEPEAAANPDAEAQRDLTDTQEQSTGEGAARKVVLLILGAILLLLLVGYGGWRCYLTIRDKKRGYK
jgi:hypothetical protein